MGSGGRPAFSCARGKHAANSAQRNRRWRQGKPSGRETTCGFGAATDDNTKLCTRKGRSHTSRAPSVKHGLFRIAIGAEQKTAARRDQWPAGSELRTTFRGWWVQRRRWPSTKQDRDARAGARLRPTRTRAPRGVRHYPQTTCCARDRAPAFETSASAGVECRLGGTITTGIVGIVLCAAKRQLRSWYIHVAEPTDDRRESEAGTERELPSTAKRRLEGGFPGAIWRFGGRCAQRRGRGYMIDRAGSGYFLSLCAHMRKFFFFGLL